MIKCESPLRYVINVSSAATNESLYKYGSCERSKKRPTQTISAAQIRNFNFAPVSHQSFRTNSRRL